MYVCHDGKREKCVFHGMIDPVLDRNKKQLGPMDLPHVHKFIFV